MQSSVEFLGFLPLPFSLLYWASTWCQFESENVVVWGFPMWSGVLKIVHAFAGFLWPSGDCCHGLCGSDRHCSNCWISNLELPQHAICGSENNTGTEATYKIGRVFSCLTSSVYRDASPQMAKSTPPCMFSVSTAIIQVSSTTYWFQGDHFTVGEYPDMVFFWAWGREQKTLQHVGAAIPVALGYALTTGEVQKLPKGGFRQAEAMWRLRHRWAARHLCSLMSEFQE